MQTKKVKALDLLRYTLPLIVRGRSGVYEIVKAEADSGRVKLYRLTPDRHHSLVISRPHDEYLEVFTNTEADHLLDTIGTLHGRNKSLTKGHATLTRRVQELEEALAEAQQQGLNNSSGAFAAVGGKAHVNDAFIEENPASKADTQLQQDIATLSHRIQALEFAQKPSSHAAFVIGPQKGLESAEYLSKTIEKHIKQFLVNAVKPGGILNGR